MKDKLTVKQERFIVEYLVDFNATAAARRAGYSPRTCEAIGKENLHKPPIKKAIDAALLARQQVTRWKAADILRDLQELATDRSVRPRDRLKAYELAGKHLGMYRDVVEHSGQLQHIDLTGFTAADLRKLIELQPEEGYRMEQ